MSSIVTFHGSVFPLSPFDPSKIFIEDIAVSLSRLPRFNGHTREFYSVAEHSVHVSEVVGQIDPDLALDGLLHDATEAYLGDMSRPLRLLLSPAYGEIEAELQAVMGKKFGFMPDVRGIVGGVDNAMLVAECIKYMPPQILPLVRAEIGSTDKQLVNQCLKTLYDMPSCHELAKEHFLDRFSALTDGVAYAHERRNA